MPTVVQFRRGTTVQNNNFLGANGEISVDTDLHVLRIADGATLGGFALVGQNCVQTIANKTYTGTSLSVTGNVSGNYILGNGSQLTGIDATSIQSGTSNVRVVSSGGNVTVGVAGTSNVVVVASTGANIAGTLGVTGNITGSYILGNGSQLTGIDATSIQSGTSNVRVVSSGGNVTVGIANTSNVVVVSTTGANITGTLNASGNANVGNIGATAVVATNLTGTLQTAAQTNITSVGTLTSLAVTGNITSGNLSGTSIVGTLTTASQTNITGVGTLTSGTWTASSISTTYTDAKVTSVASRTGAVTLAQADISGLTTGSTPTFAGLTVGTGTITGGNIVNSNANGVGNVGSSSVYYNTVFAKATSAQYADVAEKYVADKIYPPGTVVEFGGKAEVTITTVSSSPAVAGIISTNPAFIMNAGENNANAVLVALLGRVPCRVVGDIKKGDRLVSSDIPGVAKKLNLAEYQPGCIIGKALENYSSSEPGVIEVIGGRL